MPISSMIHFGPQPKKWAPLLPGMAPDPPDKRKLEAAAMPILNILNDDGQLKWDAACSLLSLIMVPDDQSLRDEYKAKLRIETAAGLPDGSSHLSKQDHVLAAKFARRDRIDQLMQTRRTHSVLAGAVLWSLQTAAQQHPEAASKNKIEFAIDRISIAEKKLGSLATLRSAWRRFRPVIHWCAALAYQAKAFGSPFPQRPGVGYVGDIVIADFLQLGQVFLAFAKDHVDFSPDERPPFWTAPIPVMPATRDPTWPDAHVLRPGTQLSTAFLATVSGYVIENDRVRRNSLVSGPGRRFTLARSNKR